MTRRVRHRWRRGISLIEAAVCVAIVGGLAVAALNAAGQTARAREAAADRAQGMALATDLMNEIRAKKYNVNSGLLSGLLTSVVGQARTSFDEVSDYDGFTDSPPTDASGTQIASREWSRTVKVSFVFAADPDSSSLVDTGVRRIDVVVTKNRRTIATLSALRTSAGEAEPR